MTALLVVIIVILVFTILHMFAFFRARLLKLEKDSHPPIGQDAIYERLEALETWERNTRYSPRSLNLQVDSIVRMYGERKDNEKLHT